MKNFSLILLAAGKGSRMNLGYNKVFYQLKEGITILEKSLQAFYDNEYLAQIIIVVNKDDLKQAQEILKEYHNLKFVVGGEKRYDSVYAGLEEVKHEFVLIHDAARCFITKQQIEDIINMTIENLAATLAYPIRDTIHLVNDDNMVVETVDRDYAYLAQTPQGFLTTIILNAYQEFKQSITPINITDDVMIVNTYTNIQVKVVESNASNYKVTYSEDVE